MDMEFDEWFDIFVANCKSQGYKGPIDKYSFECDWEDGQTPEYAAQEFVKEMNE